MKLFEKIKIGKEREIRFLGFPILQYGKKNIPNGTEKYIKLFPKSFEYKVLSTISNELKEHYDVVWICRVNAIGENYLLNFLYKEVIKNKEAKKYCFVFHDNNAQNAKVFELLGNTNTFITSVPLLYLNSVLQKKKYKYKNTEFIVHHCPLSDTSKFLHKDEHYADVIKNLVGATKYEKIKICFPQQLQDKVNNIINLKNFIFINPEVKSLQPMSDEFWLNLITNLKQKGYEIFINSKSGISKYGYSAKLDIVEAMYLASKAEFIVSMRTGFSELVSTFNIPKHIIYTDSIFEQNTAQKTFALFSLKKYPSVDKNTICEYTISANSEQEISDKILERI